MPSISKELLLVIPFSILACPPLSDWILNLYLVPLTRRTRPFNSTSPKVVVYSSSEIWFLEYIYIMCLLIYLFVIFLEGSMYIGCESNYLFLKLLVWGFMVVRLCFLSISLVLHRFAAVRLQNAYNSLGFQ